MLTDFGETTVLVYCYVFVSCGYFLVRDGWFTDFMVLGDSIALPWCMSF